METLGLTGFSLLYVGAVLFINGFWLINKVDKQEIIFIDTFVGIISFLIASYLIFNANATLQTIEAGTFTFLFSCTYLWVAFNQHKNTDGKGLGWFCLFVAITAIPITLFAFSRAETLWEMWFAACWGLWAVLWFIYFLNLVFSKIKKETIGLITIFTGIVSAWVPGYLLVSGILK